MERCPILVESSDQKTIRSIKPFLTKFCKKYPVHFTPEHVIEEIKDERSQLFYCDDGFMVSRIQKCSFTDNLVLYVWFMQSFKKQPLLHTHGEWFREMTKALKVSRVEMDTPRAGFEKYLPAEWRATGITFECDVNG